MKITYIVGVFLLTSLLEMWWHIKTYPATLTPMELYQARVHTYNLSMSMAQELLYITMLIFIPGLYEKTLAIICIVFQGLNVADWYFDFNWRTTNYDFALFTVSITLIILMMRFKVYERIDIFTHNILHILFRNG